MNNKLKSVPANGYNTKTGNIYLYPQNEMEKQIRTMVLSMEQINRIKKRNEYMKSKEWKRVTERKYAEVGHRCQRCGDIKDLQVHHITYKNLYHERLEDLQILCAGCHCEIHGVNAYKQSA